MMGRAFRDNPGYLGLLSGDSAEKRERVVQGCMLGFVRAVFHSGIVEVVKRDGAPVAAALIFPPGGYRPPPRAQWMVASAVLRSRPGRAHRFIAADRAMHANHPRTPHWYLWMLGVEPALQGQGLGSELLRSLTAKTDAAGQLCYLETDRERCIGLYQGHGFQVMSDDVLPGVNTRMWFMQRPAASR